MKSIKILVSSEVFDLYNTGSRTQITFTDELPFHPSKKQLLILQEEGDDEIYAKLEYVVTDVENREILTHGVIINYYICSLTSVMDCNAYEFIQQVFPEDEIEVLDWTK